MDHDADLAARLGLPMHLVRAVDVSAALPFAPGLVGGPSMVADEHYGDISCQARSEAFVSESTA